MSSSPLDRLLLPEDEVCTDCHGVIWAGEAAVNFEPQRYRHYPTCPPAVSPHPPAPAAVAPTPTPEEVPVPVPAAQPGQSSQGALIALLRERAVNRKTQAGRAPKRRGGYANMTVDEIARALGTDRHEVVHMLHGLQKQGQVQFKEGREKQPVSIRVTGALKPDAVPGMTVKDPAARPAQRPPSEPERISFPRTLAGVGGLPARAPGGAITRRFETPDPAVAAEAHAARVGAHDPFTPPEPALIVPDERIGDPDNPWSVNPPRPFAGESAEALDIPTLGDAYPLIRQLWEADGKVREAVRLLREAGRTVAADLVESEVPERTPLEQEVLALVEFLTRTGHLA